MFVVSKNIYIIRFPIPVFSWKRKEELVFKLLTPGLNVESRKFLKFFYLEDAPRKLVNIPNPVV